MKSGIVDRHLARAVRRRQSRQHIQGRARRNDVVIGAVENERRGVEDRGGGQRGVHQVGDAPYRIDPGFLDDQGVAAQRQQHFDIVGRLALQAAAADAQPRCGVGRHPQCGALVERHDGAAPHRRRDQNDAVGGIGRLGPGRHQYATAHTFAHRVDRQAGISRPGGGENIAEIAGQFLPARPDAGFGRGAEAALVVG